MRPPATRLHDSFSSDDSDLEHASYLRSLTKRVSSGPSTSGKAEDASTVEKKDADLISDSLNPSWRLSETFGNVKTLDSLRNAQQSDTDTGTSIHSVIDGEEIVAMTILEELPEEIFDDYSMSFDEDIETAERSVSIEKIQVDSLTENMIKETTDSVPKKNIAKGSSLTNEASLQPPIFLPSTVNIDTLSDCIHHHLAFLQESLAERVREVEASSSWEPYHYVTLAETKAYFRRHRKLNETKSRKQRKQELEVFE